MRCSMLLAGVLLVGVAGPSSIAQQAPVDVSALGPRVGQQVPDFRLPDQTGQIRTRESIMGPRGAMLVFFRSADW